MPTISSPLLAWIVILVSGALEIVFSVTLKLSDGFTRLGWTALTIGAAIASVWGVSLSLKAIPLGTAYAVWAGIGAIGTAIIGIGWFQEPANPGRLVCIGAIIAGIVGLQLQSHA
jgi:quaternary ammonium compound-resistance protein SugE